MPERGSDGEMRSDAADGEPHGAIEWRPQRDPPDHPARDAAMPPIIPGRYRHYKGNDYTVLGTARHSESMEELVVYRAEYGERGPWARHAAM